MIRFLFIFTLCGAFALSIPTAQAGLKEFFFPRKDTGPDPAQTGVAPFAYDPDKTVTPLGGLPENAAPLNLPHRTNSHIADWITGVASEVMTFQNPDFLQDMEATRIYFDPEGRKQYRQFLEDMNVIKVLESGKVYLRSFVKSTPVLLNEGALHGRYRWLYEIHMMVSYMPRDMKSYKKDKPVNQELILRVQIGRSADGSGHEGLRIEQFSGKIKAEPSK